LECGRTVSGCEIEENRALHSVLAAAAKAAKVHLAPSSSGRDGREIENVGSMRVARKQKTRIPLLIVRVEGTLYFCPRKSMLSQHCQMQTAADLFSSFSEL
jgi:hypothetical protein